MAPSNSIFSISAKVFLTDTWKPNLLLKSSNTSCGKTEVKSGLPLESNFNPSIPGIVNKACFKSLLTPSGVSAIYFFGFSVDGSVASSTGALGSSSKPVKVVLTSVVASVATSVTGSVLTSVATSVAASVTGSVLTSVAVSVAGSD